MTSGERRETHISTQQASSCEKAWFSQANEDEGWPRRPEVPTLQGSRPIVGVIGRIPRRVGFAPFRGSRAVRESILSLRVVVDPVADGVRVAFSTPKRIGSAVTRNRLRRQLRELMRERSHRLVSGWYLIAVEPGAVDRTWGQLGTSLDRALERALNQAENAKKSTKQALKETV